MSVLFQCCQEETLCKIKKRLHRKVASSNTSRFKAHAGFFHIAYEGDFQSLCSVTF